MFFYKEKDWKNGKKKEKIEIWGRKDLLLVARFREISSGLFGFFSFGFLSLFLFFAAEVVYNQLNMFIVPLLISCLIDFFICKMLCHYTPYASMPYSRPFSWYHFIFTLMSSHFLFGNDLSLNIFKSKEVSVMCC